MPAPAAPQGDPADAESAGKVTVSFVRQLASPGRFVRYYGWNVLLTFGAGTLVLALTRWAGMPAQQCYYLVVLSVLLVHYVHDSVLFNARDEMAFVRA